MTPDHRIARLAARQHGVFTRAQAKERGCSDTMIRGRLEVGVWEKVHAGTYRVPGWAPTWESGVMAACLATGAHASHRTAAALYGLGAPAPTVEVVVRHETRRRRSGVTVRRAIDLAPQDLVTVGVIPCTSPVRTLCDLAAVVPGPELAAVVDAALRRRLVTVERLRRRAQPSRGRAGSAALRRLLDDLDPALELPESETESRFLRLFRRAGLTNLVPQHQVVAGGRRFRLDFADPVLKVAVEIDGLHHSQPRQWRADIERQNLLVGAGWTVLRFPATDHRRPGHVIAHVRTVLGNKIVA